MAEDVKVPLDEIPTKRPRLDDVYCTDKDIDIFDTPNNDIDKVSNVKQQQVFMENEKIENDTSPNRDIDNDHTEQHDKGDKDEETGADVDDSDNISVLSDLSGLSEEAWKSSGGSLMWVQKQMMLGQDPRNILTKIIPQDAVLPDDLDDYTLWKLVINLLSEPPRREKLQHINTLDDVINLMKTCKKVMILTGAGVSVSCGIPDFRSRDGIYARLAVDFPDLPDPQSMFDIRYFKNDPRPFFKFAKEIYPGQFEPSKSHKFIRLFEIHNILLRNYTQNIDTLEQVAGIQNVIQCHGSFAHATCTACKHKVVADEIRKDIFDQVIPLCPKCPKDSEPAVMKPDIVFFGESLPEEFHRQMAEDKEVCDLLIVIGSSLKVRPVALIPNSLPPTVPQILINREPLKHLTFDVELLGDCDTIVGDLCKRLGEGWSNLSNCIPPLEEVTRDKLRTPPLETEDSDMVSERQGSNTRANLSESRDNDRVSDTKETNQSERKSAEICENESESKSVESCVETSLKHDTEGDVVIPDNNHKTSIAFEDELDELEELRAMWQPKRKESLAKRLEDGQYLFLPPNRYVFPGAEVYSDEESEEEHFPHRLQLLSCSSMSTEEEEDECENETSSFSTGGAQEPSTSTAEYSEQQEDKVISSASNNDNITTFSEQSKSNEYCTDVAIAKISNIQVQQELLLSNHDNSDTYKLEEENKCSKEIL